MRQFSFGVRQVSPVKYRIAERFFSSAQYTFGRFNDRILPKRGSNTISFYRFRPDTK